MFKSKAALAAFIPLSLVACSTPDGEITDMGITAIRSACPAVAIPASTGDITLFNPENSRDASAIDVVANITNLRSTCDESGDQIVTSVTFDVHAQRRDGRGAREVVLPYFVVAVQGGTQVQSKSVSRVALRFADGQLRASACGFGERPGEPRRGDPSRGRPPADHPPAQARRPVGGGRPDGRSGRSRGGPKGQLRGPGRLPAHPGPARLQRDALG